MKSKSTSVKSSEEVPFWFNPYNELYKMVYESPDLSRKPSVNLDNSTSKIKAIVIGAFTKNTALDIIEYEMDETSSLVEALGHTCFKQVVQRTEKNNRSTYLGKGKALEIRDLVEANDIDYVVCNHELTPVQFRNLIGIIHAPVTDRTMIVLELFRQQVKTKEARLQVQITELRYLLPRISSIAFHKSGSDRQSGAFFSKGSGETSYELDQRKIKNRIRKLEEEIEQAKVAKKTQRRLRDKVFKAILIGYTNAGKTTIMNSLTRNNFNVSPQVFQTVDSVFRKLDNSSKGDILIADTVGFISNLPSTWIEGFYSTLEDIKMADLLIHVIDCSNIYYPKRIETVNKVISEIGAENMDMLYVFNKVDLIGDCNSLEEQNRGIIPNSNSIIYISANKQEDIVLLKNMIKSILIPG